MQRYKQVSGGNCRLVMYRETSPGVVSASDAGVILSMASESFSAPASKKSLSIINGKRGQGKPTAGIPNYSGGVELAPYAPVMGHVLRALCGAPATATVADLTLTSAAVTDEGGGFVGLPCASSPFVQDCFVTITGTDNYNGSYRLEYGTTKQKLVIAKAYTAETLTATAKASRGQGAFLSGAAVELSTGKVGLPVSGLGVNYNEGDSVVISGTTSYDGTHVLASGTTSRQLVITTTYTAETFDGTPVALPLFYRHVFTLPKIQPTMAVEKYLDFDATADAAPYTRFLSNKVNGMNFSFGGDTELLLSLDFSVGSSVTSESPLNAASPALLPSVGFYNKEIALWLDGDRISDVESGSISQEFGIEAKAAVGDMGKRSLQTEGDPVCSCKLSAFLEHDTYTRLSDRAATVSFAISMCGVGGEEFWTTFPEAEVDTAGPQISGKGGLMQDVTVSAFIEKSSSVVEYTLFNRVASYA